jgi:hypothetical protein
MTKLVVDLVQEDNGQRNWLHPLRRFAHLADPIREKHRKQHEAARKLERIQRRLDSMDKRLDSLEE